MPPHRTFASALVLVTFAASSALAQDKPATPPQEGSKPAKPESSGNGPRIKMGGQPESAPQPTAPEAPPETKQRSEPEQWLDQLGTWPAAEAKQASIRLAAGPSVAWPLLERRMQETNLDWRMIAGVSATLGKLRDLRAIDLIRPRIDDAKMYQHSADLLDALVRIDPVGAKPRLVALLLHPASAVVLEVEKLLEPRVAQTDFEALRDVYDVGGPTARAASLRLAAKADPVAVRPQLVKALRDKDAEVAFAAAAALASGDSPEALELIKQSMASPIDRQFAYATMAMALRTERGVGREVDDGVVRTLLGGRGIKSLDQLCRASSAILLADLGYYHEVPLLDESLDRQVVPVLIDAWVGREFWSDMRVVEPLLTRRLRRLTGRTDLARPAEWAAWWEHEGATFVSRRVLLEVADDVAATMVLSVEGTGAPGGETTTITAAPDALTVTEQAPEELSLLIGPEEAKALAKLVNASGVLRAPESLAVTRDLPNSVTFGVRAGKRERRSTVRSDVPDPGVERLLAAVTETRARLSWQRYRGSGTATDAQSFVNAMSGAFAPDRSADERSRALASLIVRSIDDRRGPAWNARALAELEALPKLPTLLSSEDVDRLLLMLTQRPSLDPTAVALVGVLAKVGRREATPVILDFLVTKGGSNSRDSIVAVLRGAPREQYLAALGDARSEVRLAAFAAAETGGAVDDVVARILKAVDDKDTIVGAEAIRALGRMRIEKARPLIDRLAETPGPLRGSAIEALGMLGGRESLPTIMAAYASEEEGLRVAAIQALAASREPEGLSAIVFAMGGDTSGLVREVASRAVLDMGGQRAAAELRKLAIDPAQPSGPRARALAGYAQLAGKASAADLAKLVDDPSDEVADEAALGLARWRDPASVPHLIVMLEKNRMVQRARHSLESVSLEAFGQRDPQLLADLYSGWWELSKGRGPKRWLLDAMTLEGNPEDAILRSWAEGDSGRQAAPSLIPALRNEKWYVRRAADLALRELLGKSVGDQEHWTTAGDVERMAVAWEKIWGESFDK